MAAFDRINSGIPEMDTALDSIRLGDNVVWRISELSEFKAFVTPFIAQAMRDKRSIVYLRYADTEPLTGYFTEIKRVLIPLSHRFETFAADIHNVIEKEGREIFYIFDCLSELQTAWATDLMMGNFFKVTAPFLSSLDCVSYFPIKRGKHSLGSVNKILGTAQIFLDVYSDNRNYYIGGDIPQNTGKAVVLLQNAADKLSTAAYALGKLYLFGREIPQDKELAVYWLTRSADAGNEFAQSLLEHMESYDQSRVQNAYMNMLLSLVRLLNENYNKTDRSVRMHIDKKQRAEIRRKKQALGVKEDHTIRQG